MQTTSLIFVEPSSKHNTQRAHQTKNPIGIFIAELKQYQHTDHDPLNRDVMWCDEPIEDILLSGFWIMMQKIAQQLGKPLMTQAQILSIAPRVDRLINAGMVLIYETPQEAARVFKHQVIDLVRYATVLGYRPGMRIPVQAWQGLLQGDEVLFKRFLFQTNPLPVSGPVLNYWQTPCALFLLELIKASRAFRLRLVEKIDQFYRMNTIVKSQTLNVNCIHSPYVHWQDLSVGTQRVFGMTVKNPDEVTHYLDEREEVQFNLPCGFQKALDEIEHRLFLCDLYQRFRVNTQQWPRTNWTLDQHWLMTQTLLTQIDAPLEREFVEGSAEYARALRVIRGMTVESVCQRVCARLQARLRQPLLEEHWPVLQAQISRHVENIQKWSEVIDEDDQMELILMHLSPMDFSLSSERAIIVATGEERSFVKQMYVHSQDSAWWSQKLTASIDWTTVSVSTMNALVRASILSLDSLIDSLSLCSSEVKQIGINLLLPRLDAARMNRLIKMGLVETTFPFLVQYVDLLSADVLAPCLPVLVDETASDGRPEALMVFWKALSRVTTEQAQAFVSQVHLRSSLCLVVFEIVSIPTLFPWQMFDTIQAKLGADLYRLMILGSIALYRPKDVCAWRKIFSQSGSGFYPPRILGEGLSSQQVEEFLRTISEKKARAWAKAR